MNYRCPVCGGTGKVEPNFGIDKDPLFPKLLPDGKKECPGCNGTGMQWRNEPTAYPKHTTTIIRKPCCKQYKPDYFHDMNRIPRFKS